MVADQETKLGVEVNMAKVRRRIAKCTLPSTLKDLDCGLSSFFIFFPCFFSVFEIRDDQVSFPDMRASSGRRTQ